MSIPNLKPLHSRKIKSISTISNSKTINKKLSYLPPIHSPQGSYKNITDTDLLYEDDIPQQLDSFQKKRRTIHTFFKKNDLKMMNINQIEPMKNINILAKNVSLASFNLSQNLLENSLGEKREQGSFFINELWSHNYYKKIMKFSNLKRTMDDILKLRRNRLNETKKNYLEKQTLEFNKEIHGLDDNLSPFHIKREKGYKNRRAGVSLKGEAITTKQKSISLIEDNFSSAKTQKKILISNAKKYISDILVTCDNYDKEIKIFDKYMSLHKSNEKTIKKTNVRNIIAKQDSVVGSLSIYFQRKNDKTKVKTGQININSNWSFDKYLLEMKELEFQKSKENHEKEINLKKNQITNIIYN